ncbi:MAG: tRNA (guanosine(37)-N1)-methyltransferase TrmD [Chthoniobacterales bacterium]
MKIDVLTIFPALCEGAFNESMLKRAQAQGLAELKAHDLRLWAKDKHRLTDDTPYGGGPGMVMKVEPIFEAEKALRSAESKVILMSPQGRRLDQKLAQEYSKEKHLIILCGHYEGIDQRVADNLVDEEVSIGDYVLTNGAIAAVVFVDAIVRLIPGVLGHAESAPGDSFDVHGGILDHPHYTRPEVFNDWKVPEILLSGNHGAIAAWRKEQAKELTRKRRPDLLDKKEDA